MSERWMPKNLETYWSVIDANPMHFAWQGNPLEIARWEAGNVFKTHDQALIASINIKSLLLSLHDKGTSTANSETLKGTFTECLKKFAKHHADVILQKARESRLSEQYNNAPKETKLPEWVEVSGYVFDARNGYGKIVSGSVKSCYIEFDGGAGDFVPEAFADLKQARLRPYNAEEMKALIGKVVGNEHGNMFLVTAFVADDGGEVCADGVLYNADDLLECYTINGSPCGVLEHLENGEWVK